MNTKTNIFDLHEKLTAHLFPAYASEDKHFLALALCGEAGELANLIKKRWRDGVDLRSDVQDEIADCRVYIELLAKCYDIEGAKLDHAIEDHWFNVTIENYDERTLPIILCREVAKLADAIFERWGNGATAQIKIVRICIEAFAKKFDIGGAKLDEVVEAKLLTVVAKHEARLAGYGTLYRALSAETTTADRVSA